MLPKTLAGDAQMAAIVISSIITGNYYTLPYPLSSKYRAHGIPMILMDVIKQIHDTAKTFEPAFCAELEKQLEDQLIDTLDNFVDEDDFLYEVITADNKIFNRLFGRHINPGRRNRKYRKISD